MHISTVSYTKITKDDQDNLRIIFFSIECKFYPFYRNSHHIPAHGH